MIEVRNLTKTFRDRGRGRARARKPETRAAAWRALLSRTKSDENRGRVVAARDVSFACRPGEVFGLLGPNGAGKTTVLRMISTAIKPTSGEVRVDGRDAVAQPLETRRRVGFLSSNTGLYGRLTAREVLRYFGRLHGMAPAALDARVEALAETFRMAEFLDRPCDTLSTGMRQKVNIARTVLHDPPVMVFDEPTAGLDVLTSRVIVKFIRDCRNLGKTVLFSTHVMSEVDALCDRVAMIHRGRLVFDGSLDQLRDEGDGNLDDAFVRRVGLHDADLDLETELDPEADNEAEAAR